MADPALWFPGARLNQLASVDGGSILGGRPKCLHHDTETSGWPSYSSGFWPNMTINPATGEVRQHIPANRAARALRNETGGVQTNRWNVFQIEWLGFANKVPFHPVGAEIAQWLHDVRGCPLTEGVSWRSYPSSYGQTSVRLSGGEWNDYSGHLGHMHAPENDHGDPGWPFPIAQILEGGDVAFTDEDKDFLRQIRDTITGEGDFTARINTISKVRGQLADLPVPPTVEEIAAAVVAALPAGSVDAAVIKAACKAAVEEALNTTKLVTPI
jgi:hypothetical protein